MNIVKHRSQNTDTTNNLGLYEKHNNNPTPPLLEAPRWHYQDRVLAWGRATVPRSGGGGPRNSLINKIRHHYHLFKVDVIIDYYKSVLHSKINNKQHLFSYYYLSLLLYAGGFNNLLVRLVSVQLF